MAELLAVSYEEMRQEYFEKQRDSAERRMNYWCRERQADRVGWMEASDRASEAGAQYNFYKDALEVLENQPKWISVKEALPETSLRVLVCDGHKTVKAGCRFGKDKTGKQWKWYIEGTYQNDITHWAYMPEPPKEET